MKTIALIVVVLLWMIIASIPRCSKEKKTTSWREVVSSKPENRDQLAVAEQEKETPTGPKTEATAKIPNPSDVASRSQIQPPSEKKQLPIARGDGKMTLCKKSGDSRILILSKKKNGCELSYTKGDRSKTIALSHFSTKPCEQVLSKMSKKFESTGYHCVSQSN